MSYIDNGPEHHEFSRCTLEQIRYVVGRAGESCWKVSRSGIVMGGLYPGLMVSDKAYCLDVIQDQDAVFDSLTVCIKRRCVQRPNVPRVPRDMTTPGTTVATTQAAVTEKPPDIPEKCTCQCPCDCPSIQSDANPEKKVS
ncbi:hypothetical protein MTO96_043692 [Rhipicephalus appendiculatus]